VLSSPRRGLPEKSDRTRNGGHLDTVCTGQCVQLLSVSTDPLQWTQARLQNPPATQEKQCWWTLDTGKTLQVQILSCEGASSGDTRETLRMLRCMILLPYPSTTGLPTSEGWRVNQPRRVSHPPPPNVLLASNGRL
jgi:hypothetical protein